MMTLSDHIADTGRHQVEHLKEIALVAQKIGERTYEVAPGIKVLPICGDNEKPDGWQVVVNDEYDNDFRTKREAVKHALSLVRAPNAS